jgi:hypothetical protein
MNRIITMSDIYRVTSLCQETGMHDIEDTHFTCYTE